MLQKNMVVYCRYQQIPSVEITLVCKGEEGGDERRRREEEKRGGTQL